MKGIWCLLSLFVLSLTSVSLATNPNREFSVDKTEGSASLLVTFDASNIRPAKKFIWNFGNGETLTTTNSIVTYNYKQAGNFTASLKYAVNASDKDIKNLKDAGSVLIKVLQKTALPPVASLNCTTNNLLVACNALGSFDGQGQPLAFNFDYADGFSETNLTGLSTHAYAQAGLYLVKLTVSNLSGLTALSTVQVQPVVPPNVLPNLALNCVSSKPNYLECDSSGSTDSDGSIITYQYTFDDSSTETRGDTGKVAHSFSSGGVHLVKLTGLDNDGGESSLQKSFVVIQNTNPVADFNCVSDKPYQVSCQSVTTDVDLPNDSLVEYLWSSNNQAISNSTSASLAYNFHSAGDITIVLTVKDSYGGVGSVSKIISVKDNIAPVASFTCKNIGVQNIHCDSTSTDSDGQISSTSWTLDDGTNLTGASFDHFFTNGGSHQVTILVTDDLGASNSSVSDFLIISNQLPTVDLYASTLTGVAPLTINFEARNLLDIDGSIASVKWTFSDGTTAIGANVSHVFNTVGTFTATLKVTDNLGAVTTKSTNITTLEPLKEIPVLSFKYFEDGSTLIDLRSSPVKTQFDLDRAFYTIDGNQVVPVTDLYPGTRTLYDLKTYGTHLITLTVVDIRGQTASISYTLNLLQDPSSLKPVVDFRTTQSSVKTVFFNLNRSFNPDSLFAIKNYHLEFGDGLSADITDDTFATHTYLNAGTFTTSLTVTTGQGTKATANKVITVTNLDVPIVSPVASFNYQINSWAQNVSFYNEKSGTPNGSVISYSWEFGDGSTGTGDRVAHFYEPGSYLVTLTVTDSAGLRNSQTQHVNIFQEGSDIVAEIDCGTSTAQTQSCTVTALDKFNEINSVRVLWGDGTSSTLIDPVVAGQGIYKISKQYFTSGQQTIGVYVSTVRGEARTTTITKNVILPSPIAKINCSTDNLKLICNSEGSTDPSGAGFESFTFEFGNNDSVTNAIGDIQYVYSSSGTYIVKLTTLSNSGLISSVSTQVIVYNAPPVAFINCYTIDMFVSCDALGSFDPQASPLIFEFDYGDSFSEINTSGVSGHSYTSGGTYEIKVRVTNAFGLFSDAQMVVMPLTPLNYHPLAQINCITQGSRILCDAYSSSDRDGVVKSAFWDFGDGTYANGFLVEHQYNNFGHYNLKLTVTDDGFESSSVTQVIPINSFSPTAIGMCSVLNQTMSCDGSESFDSDGNIIEYKWDIEGEDEILGQKIIYEFNSPGQKKISLRIIDNDGNVTSKIVKTLDVVNVAPIALFACVNVDEAHLKCSASSSSDDGRIVSHAWDVNGISYNGETQEFNFSEDGDYIISLKITDNMGEVSTSSQTYLLTPSLIVKKSLGQIAALGPGDQEIFYSLSTQAQFHVDNALLDKDVSRNIILVNGKVLENEKVIYNFNEGDIVLNLDLNDGENDISFSLLDENGKNINAETVVYAGSRSVALNIVGEDGRGIRGAAVDLTPANNKEVTLAKRFNEEVVQLHNVPNEDFLLNGSFGEYRGVDVLFKSDNESFLALHGYSIVASDQNNNFADGILGWEVKDSSYILGTKNLKLSPNQLGIATLRRTLHATEENPVVTFSYKIHSSYDDEYFSLTMRNKSTGETLFDFFSTKDNQVKLDSGIILGQDLTIEKSISTKSKDDVVEIEMKLFTRHGILQENIVNNVLNLLLQQALAIDITGIEGQVAGYSLSSFKISHTLLFDPLSSLLSMPLSHLSIGQLPIYPGGKKTFPLADSDGGLESSNLIYVDYQLENLNTDKIETVKLQILNPNNGYSILDEALSTKSVQIGSLVTSTFNLKSQNIPIEDLPRSLVLKLTITTASGRQDSVFVSNKVSPLYFKSLISLTSYLPSINNYRFSFRDIGDAGGDDWIKPEHLRFIESLTQGVPRQLNLTFNDFSKMNGGKFPPHFEHGDGNVFDAFLDDYNDFPEELVSTRLSAQKMIMLLNDQNVSLKATKVIVSYDDSEISEFNNEIQSSCLANGKLARDFIKNDKDNPLTSIKDEAGHKNHFHLQFDNGVATIGRSKSYEICHQLDTTLGTISLKRCNGPLLDQNKFEIWAKVFNSNAPYQKLKKSDLGYDYIPLDGEILELKILFKGDSLGGCFDKIVYSDARPEARNCEDENEYGLTYINDGCKEHERVCSSAFVGESAKYHPFNEERKAKYFEYLSSGTSGHQYSTISICKESEVGSYLARINNSKITNKSKILVKADDSSYDIYDSEIINSTISSDTSFELESVVVKDSLISGYVSISNAKITSTQMAYPLMNLDVIGAWAYIVNINIDKTTISNVDVTNFQSYIGDYSSGAASIMKDSQILNSKLLCNSVINSNIVASSVFIENVINAQITNSKLSSSNAIKSISGTFNSKDCSDVLELDQDNNYVLVFKCNP